MKPEVVYEAKKTGMTKVESKHFSAALRASAEDSV